MGEVSRLLIASPRLRQMETFFLIVFSSLVGIDAPYFCLFLEILLSHFPLLFFRWLSQCCVDTGVFICIDILLLCDCRWLCFLDPLFQTDVNDFICHHGISYPLLFQLQNTSALSLQHVYCAILSAFTMGIILY